MSQALSVSFSAGLFFFNKSGAVSLASSPVARSNIQTQFNISDLDLYGNEVEQSLSSKEQQKDDNEKYYRSEFEDEYEQSVKTNETNETNEEEEEYEEEYEDVYSKKKREKKCN